MEDYAVYLQKVNKYYGTKQILVKLNMIVKRGTIYGLLGSSGCGKTTLLSCIVGRRSIDSGCLWVLGGVPGEDVSGVPGPRVGYMPQDVALVGEFSVRGAIYYFGHLYKMSKKNIQARYEFLKELLELPRGHKMVKNCSGGQQRRISFACALVHEPELLILDEPTVGLDPVMRNSIWNYLVEMAHNNNTTIIITTHYIEEANQADKLGLMRNGTLLTEGSPSELLTSFNTDTLEDAFLKLCKQHESGIMFNQNVQENYFEEEREFRSNSFLISKQKLTINKNIRRNNLKVNKHHVIALLRKNNLQYFKNLTCLSINILFPVVNILTFLIAIGRDVNINLGIVNDEHSLDTCNSYNRENTTFLHNHQCDFQQLSCRFLDDFNDEHIKKIFYTDFKVAMEDAIHGKVVGVLYISKTFTEALRERMENNHKIDNETLSLSEIKVWLDMSNRQIGLTLKSKLLAKFVHFQKKLFKDCEYLEKLIDQPLNFHYLFGNEKEEFINSMVPGILLSVVYFLTTTMTYSVIIQDRSEGVWDRSIVAGVTSAEIILTHFMTQSFIVCFQVIEVVIIAFVVYQIEYVGNLFLIALMIFLQGIGGMVCGFWISVVSKNQSMASILCTGMFFPVFLLCGMLWPLESQPIVLRYISKSLPFTAAVESLRHIMRKGWNIEHFEVLNGIGISLIWIVGFVLLSTYFLSRKR
nr:ABC transporter G family member 20-like isoform X2 [Onthophagus taurus]